MSPLFETIDIESTLIKETAHYVAQLRNGQCQIGFAA